MVERFPRRVGMVGEQERWSLSVGNALGVPEDDCLKLTFSKRTSFIEFVNTKVSHQQNYKALYDRP